MPAGDKVVALGPYAGKAKARPIGRWSLPFAAARWSASGNIPIRRSWRRRIKKG